jgi:hypothetical protein
MRKSTITLLRKLLFVDVFSANGKISKQRMKTEKELEETSAAVDKAIAEFLADIKNARLNAIINAHENEKKRADFEVIKFTYLGLEHQN